MSTTFHPHFLGFFYIYKVPLFKKNMCPFQKRKTARCLRAFGKRLQLTKKKNFCKKMYEICQSFFPIQVKPFNHLPRPLISEAKMFPKACSKRYKSRAYFCISELYGIPMRKTPRDSIPPRPFSPVIVLRRTSHTLMLSVNGVKQIFATI